MHLGLHLDRYLTAVVWYVLWVPRLGPDPSTWAPGQLWAVQVPGSMD